MATTDNRLPTEGTQIDIEARLAAIETALAGLMADTTGQSIATAISGLGATLGSDRALIDGSNIASPSTFRQNIGLARITPTITATNIIYSAAQIGNMVIGSAEMVISSASITVWTDVASINVKPTVNITVPAVRTGNGSHVGMIQIKTDGTIRLFSTQALNNNNIAFTFSYRTD